VAGDSFINNNQDFHATVWDGTKPTDLGTLSGGTSSSALALNNDGQVVGYSWTTDAPTDPVGLPTTRAVLWNGTTMIDLNSVLDESAVSEGWRLTQATGINDQGWIVGDAIKFGQRAGVLLIPIPEPETYALMLTGLGLIGFMVRHKKSEVRI
jgi:probable HAF family extracellular repeat protein